MGSDKAFLAAGGRTLLQRAIELAATVAEDVKIVAPHFECSSCGTSVKDIFPGRGPLGGIHAALSSTPSEWNLILGVDLPFVDKGFLDYLVVQARSSQAVVTVPRTGGRFQPLCAVYRKQFARSAENALLQGRNKIDALFPSVTRRVIDEAEMARQGYCQEMFRNLNTPEDWEQARQELAKA